MTDHIDRYPLDNREKNLRKTTYKENNMNKVTTTLIEKAEINKIRDDLYVPMIVYRNPDTNKGIMINEKFDARHKAIQMVERYEKRN